MEWFKSLLIRWIDKLVAEVRQFLSKNAKIAAISGQNPWNLVDNEEHRGEKLSNSHSVQGLMR